MNEHRTFEIGWRAMMTLIVCMALAIVPACRGLFSRLGGGEEPEARAIQTKVQMVSGGDKLQVVSGGEIEVQSGATLDIQSGATVGFDGGLDLNGSTLTWDADGDTTAAAATDDMLLFTTLTTGTVSVRGGNFTVGNGSPSIVQDGEDAYIEDRLEVDGPARFDGAITAVNINASGSMTATAGFIGDIVGDVTGDVTGDLTGDVTSSGTSSFADINASGTVTAATRFIGDVMGDVTGDVTGDLTGDVTSSGTSSFADINASGTVTAASGLIYGASNLFPLGHAADGRVIYCGITAGFTGTVVIALGTHDVTTPMVAIATLQTPPAATAAFVTVDISGTDVTIGTWDSSYSAGSTETVVNYCIYGVK